MSATLETPQQALPRFLDIKWSRYIKPDHIPHKKQVAYLALPHLEALYGGAAYGGKSDVLLMAALQYFDQPNYSGVIFRQELTAANLSEAIESRCKEWLQPYLASGEVTYKDHTFRSCEGGMLTFGYLKKVGSELRYDSAQFHYIGFDELTHFTESQYTYLFSRLRHRGDRAASHIPLRMRGGTNPGGPGHLWVMRRFGIERGDDGQWRGKDLNTPFLQAKVDDNPSGDAKSYIKSLEKMTPLERARKKDGDWSAAEEAQFKDYWFKSRWQKVKEFYHLDTLSTVSSASLNQNLPGVPTDSLSKGSLSSSQEIVTDSRIFHQRELLIFATVDSACSEMTGTEGKVYRPNQQPSWNACSIWGMTPQYDLLWLDVFHNQSHLPAFIRAMMNLFRTWTPAHVHVESNTIGSAVCQLLMARGVNVYPVPSKTDKIMRSQEAQVRSEMGKVWLPEKKSQPWLQDCENELFTWTGNRHDVADRVDTLSMAGQYVSKRAYGHEDFDSLREHAPSPYSPSGSLQNRPGGSQMPQDAFPPQKAVGMPILSGGSPLARRRAPRRQLLFRGL